MSWKTADQPIAGLTKGDLRDMIADVVRQVIREEIRRDYYVNEDGLKVLYAEEDIAPEYLAQLRRDYEDIEAGRVALVEGDKVLLPTTAQTAHMRSGC